MTLATKKLKTQRKNKRARMDRQYDLRSIAAHVQTAAFLACHELILYHLLEACTLATVIALSHTSTFFAPSLKHFSVFASSDWSISLLGLRTRETIGGSSLPLKLAPPTDDDDDWTPNNLNIYMPVGNGAEWEHLFT
ncbi:hypothetical protein B0H13DRAFT_2319493 [Mycena leptocephala]|nr:hypothetical protein B0H13DRAFT_2319493 [Mycena leptocephala]